MAVVVVVSGKAEPSKCCHLDAKACTKEKGAREAFDVYTHADDIYAGARHTFDSQKQNVKQHWEKK